jgi:hypothetical protein
MRCSGTTIILRGLVTLLLLACMSLSVHAEEDTAVVTMVDGKAHVYIKGQKTGSPLRKNDRVRKGQEIRVGDKSRLELRYPDGTFMRFAERSTIIMDDITYDGKTQSKKMRVDMIGGKLWAKVKRLVTADSKIEVKTVNAVAGVRGTTYRVNVNEDNSALIRVYDGSVDVAGVQRAAAQPSSKSLEPVPVEGPHEVPPPYHEVTMEEWHVIVESFQQITISPQGVASKPEEFNLQQDLDDWVKWNQERDKKLQY